MSKRRENIKKLQKLMEELKAQKPVKKVEKPAIIMKEASREEPEEVKEAADKLDATEEKTDTSW